MQKTVAPQNIEIVETTKAPKPGGHYVQGTIFGDLLFISGQLPVAPDDTHALHRSFEEQARQALDNVVAILAAAGSSTAGVLKVTAYIHGVENWPILNRVFADVFGSMRPARSVVPVPQLHHGYLVEIEAIATVARKHGGPVGSVAFDTQQSR